jgi:hypothetical protein
MKTALLAAVVVASIAGIADAQKYVVRNGRAVTGGGGASGGSGGGASGPAAAPAQGVGGAPQYGAPIGYAGGGSDGRFVAARGRSGGGGHRSFYGGGARRIGAGVYSVPQRALESGGSGEDSGGGSAPEEAPPHFSKPGALIRTEGHRQYQYAEAGNHREHTVDAGEIKLDPRKANHVGRAPGLKWSAPDKLPPCTPGTLGCGSSGGNAITPNSGGSGGGDTTIVHNGAHDNENGNGNGRGNNGFGGGTGFDPSF